MSEWKQFYPIELKIGSWMNVGKLTAGILSLFRTRFKILAYHGVVKDSPGLYEVSLPNFQEQMRILKDSGYRVLGLDQAVEMMKHDQLPSKAIAITFDDAHKSILENAVPILAKYHYSATVFVPTGYAGKIDAFSDGHPNGKAIMTWGQLRSLRDNNVTVGSHSVTHRDLSKLPVDDLELEINQSYDDLLEQMGNDYYYFAYPYGLLNDDVRNRMQLSKFKGALCFGSVLSNWEKTDMYLLKREKVLSITSHRQFRWIINPKNDFIRGSIAHARKRLVT